MYPLANRVQNTSKWLPTAPSHPATRTFATTPIWTRSSSTKPLPTTRHSLVDTSLRPLGALSGLLPRATFPLLTHQHRTHMLGIDLFAGAGGLSLGAAQAGINVTVAVEQDQHAAATYRTNHPACNILTDDIRTITDEQIRSIPKGNSWSIIFGGPPCQRIFFTPIPGLAIPQTQPNWLFQEFIRFVRVWEPDFIVFENVRGITDTARGLFLTEVLSQFSKQGYTLTSGVLNAQDYGVPQNRARFFLLGAKRDTALTLPMATHSSPPTVQDAIADLPALTNGASTSWLPYGKATPSPYALALRSSADGSPNHLVTRNAEYILERYSHIPQGGNWQDIPINLMTNYQDFSRCHTGIYSRLRLDKPSTGNWQLPQKHAHSSYSKPRAFCSRSSPHTVLS